MDFFAPFDTKSFSAYGGMASTSSYLTNPMSQYYGASPMAASQFMSASPTSMASMYSSAGHMAALQQPVAGSVSPLTGSSSAQNFGSNPISPSIIGAMT